jgi:hypothetical protein
MTQPPTIFAIYETREAVESAADAGESGSPVLRDFRTVARKSSGQQTSKRNSKTSKTPNPR